MGPVGRHRRGAGDADGEDSGHYQGNGEQRQHLATDAAIATGARAHRCS
jgi:hypothetical protein